MLGYYEPEIDARYEPLVESGRNKTVQIYLDDILSDEGNLIVHRGMRIPENRDELMRIAYALGELTDLDPRNDGLDDNTTDAFVALGQTLRALDSLAPSTDPVQLTLDTYTPPRQIKPLTYMVESDTPISRAQAIAAAVKHAGNKARERNTRDAQAFGFCIHTNTARQWQVVLEE